MTNINQRPQDFRWANDRGANLKEPIQGLKEKGWQYADIPTASNFNWLINELSKWDKYLEGRIDGNADDLVVIQKDLNRQTKELRRDLKMTVTVLEALLNKVVADRPHPPLPLLPKLPDIRD
jgi:hypothetical protein